MTNCPKCNSPEVHLIHIAWPRIGAAMPIGLMENAQLEHRVCTACGYVESYVPDAGARAEIARKWPRAGG